ncbi:MAG: glycosyltransferase family 2 protein [Nitrosomonadales bacterium]|nr:glycosyltransferase family 2 protein [Nitrosomonadales bacterium]
MANRVHRAFRRLTVKQRARVGLSLWGAFFDLPGAYRITTQFRWRLTYLQWIELCDRLNDEDVEQIRLHIANFALPPHFHILLRAGGAEQGAIRATLDSLKRQLFQNFTCVVLDADGKGGPAFDAEMALGGVGLNSCVVTQPRMSAWLAHLNAALAGQQEWVMMLSPGDVLPAHALYWFASGALARPDAAVLYSDDDALDAEEKRCEPRFKPDWSLAHMRATNFVGDAATLRGSEVAAAGGISPDDCRYGSYDLLLRVIDAAGDAGELSAAHIPAVLLHRMHVPNASSDQEDSNAAWEQQALRAHLSRNSVAGEVIATLPGCRRVRYALPDEPPLVSIIVPTRDEPAIIRQCVESILAKTTYPRFEILVVDNQSADPEALAYLARIAGQSGIRVLRYDRPFNYSAINNFAVSEARGEILCLLNNDTEVISPDWLEEMAGHLLQPKVGVVGAKLFFPDGRVQHAGDTVGPGGCANHLHSFIGRNDPGYCNRAAVAQELSAVTGACMLVWKSLYQKLGGLDEQHLTVAFNDVDFCLRAREAGYRVVWTPHAELFHHESVSRGKDQSPDKMRRAKREVAYMRKRWKRVMRHDPFYNPNLSYERPDFSLSHAPMVKRPWQI